MVKFKAGKSSSEDAEGNEKFKISVSLSDFENEKLRDKIYDSLWSAIPGIIQRSGGQLSLDPKDGEDDE